MQFSFHASHEQFQPQDLLRFAQLAEDAGFDAVFSSDHLQPWSPLQGHSGFLWAWLGAALQATARARFAAITIPGGWRYHPAITAQAIATVAQMFPGRLPWVALGSGEALNECVTGGGWPAKDERVERLEEAVHVIRLLLQGKRVSSRCRIRVSNAQVWSRPAQVPLLIGAALSVNTARRLSACVDGLLTVATRLDTARDVVTAFQKSGPPERPMHAKVDLSWAPSEEQALLQAHAQWKVHAIERERLADLRTPDEFEAAAAAVRPEDMRAVVLVSSRLDQHIEWLRERAALGFESLDLHNVGTNQQEFIEAFGRHVLPALRERTA